MCPQESLPRRPGQVGWRFGFSLWLPMPLSLSFPSCKMGDDSISLVARLLVQLPAVVGAPWTLNVSRPAVRSLSGGPVFLIRSSPPTVSPQVLTAPVLQAGKEPCPPKAAGTAAAYPALAQSWPPVDQRVPSSPAAWGLVLIYPLFLEGTLRLSCLKSLLGNCCLNSEPGPSPLPVLYPVVQGEHRSMLPGSHLR